MAITQMNVGGAKQIILIICLFIQALPPSDGKYCVMINTNVAFETWLSLLNNCTFIDGFLDIRISQQLGTNKAHELVKVLNHIKYVTGYIHVWHAFPFPIFSMKNLRVIYGDILFEGSYSLLFQGLNNLVQVDFRSLKSISRGNVGFRKNKQQSLCYAVEMINWNEILDYPNKQKMTNEQSPCTGSSSPFNCNVKCNKIDGKSYCYGSEEGQCQNGTRCKMNRFSITERCFYNSTSQSEQHCHFLCAGGCFNTSSQGCVGCIGPRYKGECFVICPEGTYLLTKYICVKSCPKTMLTFGRACVASCPDGFANKNRICTSCQPNCPKTCKLLDSNGNHIFEAVNRSTLLSLKNCEYLVGSLMFGPKSFVKKSTNPDTIAAIDDFMALSKLKRIDGVLHIDLTYLPEDLKNHPKFQSVFFLENLEEIYEIKSKNVGPWQFVNTPFEYLGMKSLRKFNALSLVFFNNVKLKYSKNVKWNKLGVKRVTDIRSAPSESCDGKCNAEFGCMGPGLAQCLNK